MNLIGRCSYFQAKIATADYQKNLLKKATILQTQKL